MKVIDIFLFQGAVRTPLIAVLLMLALLEPALGKGRSYASPQEAADALMHAVRIGGINPIIAVLGPEGRAIASSGDAVADQVARTRLADAYDEAHTVQQVSATRAVLIVGKDDFPFPIPIVADGLAWRFDTVAATVDILKRRIVRNELAAIEALRACVDAEREFAEADRDGKGVQYARRILSAEGRRDGLYWPTAGGEPESPLGPLIAEARAEGYERRAMRTTPYHGYLFRVLTAQGKNAKGGAREYVVDGRMIGGFGIVAAPAEYGNSGVMTFMVNHDGIIYQKDLGPQTTFIGSTMRAFNPDDTWREIAPD